MGRKRRKRGEEYRVRLSTNDLLILTRTLRWFKEDHPRLWSEEAERLLRKLERVEKMSERIREKRIEAMLRRSGERIERLEKELAELRREIEESEELAREIDREFERIDEGLEEAKYKLRKWDEEILPVLERLRKRVSEMPSDDIR